jgi:hypothetical protein
MLAVTVLLCSLLSAQEAQQPRPASPPPQTTRKQPPTDADDSPSSPMTPAKMLKYQHDDAMKDIDKLVKLVGEVQDEIEKAGENVLPLSSLKKLEEVERLSRRIRNKIKQ